MAYLDLISRAGMSRRLKAVLQYDGSAYRGWQRQLDAPTVQEACEVALARVLGKDVPLVAAGRTDTGVHARGQVVHFDHDRTIASSDLRRAWNAELPRDIWIERLTLASPEFHARHDAIARSYRYFIAQGAHAASPFVRRYAWSIDGPLAWDSVEAATRLIGGTHDFRGFGKGTPGPQGSGERDPDGKRPGPRNPGECTVYAASWGRSRNGRAFEITADRFLRHMVRALVGALVAIGRGRLTPSELAAALEPDGRRTTGRYAPPHGLFLWRVEYPRPAMERTQGRAEMSGKTEDEGESTWEDESA